MTADIICIRDRMNADNPRRVYQIVDVAIKAANAARLALMERAGDDSDPGGHRRELSRQIWELRNCQSRSALLANQQPLDFAALAHVEDRAEAASKAANQALFLARRAAGISDGQ